MLLLPLRPVDAPSTTPLIKIPFSYQPKPDPLANLKKYTGRCLDRIIGIIWWMLTLLGAGSGIIGIFNFFLGLGAWTWWKIKPSGYESTAAV